MFCNTTSITEAQCCGDEVFSECVFTVKGKLSNNGLESGILLTSIGFPSDFEIASYQEPIHCSGR